MNHPRITTLFLDIGGVLLTNGWDHHSRKLAAETFGFDYEEMDARHHMTFDTYEVGKVSLDDYLHRVLFYRKRDFTQAEFKDFMFAQTQPFPGMIELVREVRARHRLKVAVVSNEGRELTEYRIRAFKLGDFVDFFISSCFVHFRKPDAEIYRLALDIAQVAPDQVLYIEDRPMFIEVASTLGIRGIRHERHDATRRELEALGLSV